MATHAARFGIYILVGAILAGSALALEGGGVGGYLNNMPDASNVTNLTFPKEFIQLVHMVQNDSLNDSQIAAVLDANTFTPGMINKLLLTNKLGNESLGVIYENGVPPGVYKKATYYGGDKGHKDRNIHSPPSEDGNNGGSDVPEFSAITIGAAAMATLLGIAYIRKR